MGFYDLPKEERSQLVESISGDCKKAFSENSDALLLSHFSNGDTYIRKAAYQATGRIYNQNLALQGIILNQLWLLAGRENEKVRQTAINAAGEIGMYFFDDVAPFFDQALFDSHHSVRNAVIGSLKKMGQRNPVPSLGWAKKYLKHPDKEVRREICHGIELRGRTHPEDVLPLLETLQNDQTSRVRKTLVHVIGQISYKRGCLPKVIRHLSDWENKALVRDTVDEIIDVHSEKRYAKFTALTQQQVIDYIEQNLKC